MLCLGSIETGQVINEVRYKGTILQRNYRKMTILWSFSYNSVVKFHVRKMEVTSHNTTVFFGLFDLIIYVSVNNFSVYICLDGLRWVEPVLRED